MRTLLPWLSAVAVAAADPSLFNSRIRPILLERCVNCHGGAATVSGFDLTTEASFRKGGRNGPAVVAGNAPASRLFQYVSQGKMPPGGKLDDNAIAAVREWIQGGAPWGSEERILPPRRAGKDWWAFRPPVKPPVPRIQGATSPIDAFLLEKLRQKGLDFAPPADHRTLQRRIHFALVGLPPAPDRVDEPYESTVERLLQSPHYGERWARHWLDIARFGETDGGEHNHERFHAWPYRDYVIEALNSDKPYTDFIREQIAGDVLAPDDPKRIAATGFLTAGPWDSVSAILNKDLRLKQQARMDELDDMVTTTMATFLGLTVNCARCHDHKFDPIPTRDYYRLTAVFSGVGFGDREIATPEQRARHEAAVKPLSEAIKAVNQEIAALEDPVRAALRVAKYRALDEQRRHEPQRLPLNPVFNHNRFAPVRSRYWRLVVTKHSGQRPRIDRLQLQPSGRLIADWQPGMVIEEPAEVTGIVWSTDHRTGSGEGSVEVYRLEASDDGSTWRTVCSSLDHIARVELDLPEVSEAELEARLQPADRQRRVHLLERRAGLQRQLDGIPPLRKIYCAKPRDLEKAYVLDRGNVQKPGEEVTPGALSAIDALPADLTGAAATDGQRRLALADWIAHARNPLTARVIVNRVWSYHFGNGLVNTPSDFGFNGDRPSHPELLDWLAVSFMENGWSLKWLQRQIVLTRAYRQSARLDARAHAVDAANRWLWRMPWKRMDAEVLRDSLLFTAGNLDTRTGGPSFALQKKGARGSYIYSLAGDDGPDTWRRAVYRFVVRGGERIFLDSFDCPDPSVATPQRSVSNTPVQALALLNNRFVLQQAERLAARLEQEAGSQRAAQVRRAYQVLFQREPSAEESSRGVRFLASQPLALYCRALYNTNEFVYVP